MLGPIITDIDGLTLTDEDKELLTNPLIGGVIFFTRNYSDPEQLQALVQSIKSLPRALPLLISVDHEGGRVQRFRKHFTELPSMGKIGSLYKDNPEQAKRVAFHIGWLMAAELIDYGIDFSYAPVLDLDVGISKVIVADRGFASTPMGVIDLAAAFIDGMAKAGMAATGKHFPGHGFVEADSHYAIPFDNRELDALWQQDLLPYQALIETNRLAAVMTAHIIYENIDPMPPCFSQFWLQRVLREQLGFNGVIFSDDLTMEGAASVGGFGDRAQLALEAGCDILLVCNNRKAALEVLERTAKIYTPTQISQERCQQLYAKPAAEKLVATAMWHESIELINQLKG